VVAQASAEQKRAQWVPAATLAALIYPTIAVAFAKPLHPSSSHSAVIAWRLAAWLISAVTYVVHLGYEHWRLRNSPFRGALHGAAAVALGGFLLAARINLQQLWDPAAHQNPHAPLALAVFPAVTGVPAFLAGLGLLALLRRFAAPTS